MSTTKTTTLDDVTTQIVTGITTKAKWYDILERVLWTLLQVTTGEIIRNFANDLFRNYNVMWNGHIMQLGMEWVIAFTFVITVLKNVIASHLGNGTASTLPAQYEPVLPGVVTTTTTVDTSAVPANVDPNPAPVVPAPDTTPSVTDTEANN